MPFITVMQSPRHHQISLDEILLGEVQLTAVTQHDPTGTVTRFYERVPANILEGFDVEAAMDALKRFTIQYSSLYRVENRRDLYRSFKIPKKGGGWRQIDAPCEDLMCALRELRGILEDRCEALFHTAAFAYVPGRSTVDSIRKHQQNKSRWFLKTDFSNFFGSTTHAFVMSMLSRIFPFSEIVKSEEGKSVLSKALELCFLDGGLPQGTPISPMLTNLIMIPIDYAYAKELRSKGYVYTRYADDILISHVSGFSSGDVLKFLGDVLAAYHAPYVIKPEKTRYASSSGSNWNLGVMLNGDNNITVGYKNKQVLRAKCHQFIENFKQGAPIDPHDVQVLSGVLSYYSMVEPAYMEGFVRHVNRKHRCNLMRMMKLALAGGTT